MATLQVALLNNADDLHKPDKQEILALWRRSDSLSKHDEWYHWCGELMKQLDDLIQGIDLNKIILYWCNTVLFI